jgi:hypothetical protein
MQLRLARLCLDCDDVHDSQKCPACASETFAYLSRWVPMPEGRGKSRTAAAQEPALQHPRTPTPKSAGKLVGYGVLGVGVVGLAQWLLKGRAKMESAAGGGAGDLK